MEYYWPGNLRELRNVIKRSVLLSDSNCIEVNVLPFEIVNYQKLKFEHIPETDTSTEPSTSQSFEKTYHSDESRYAAIEKGQDTRNASISDKSLKAVSLDAEYNLIVEALKQANYNKSKAARLLDIDRKTLYNKMKGHKLLNTE